MTTSSASEMVFTYHSVAGEPIFEIVRPAGQQKRYLPRQLSGDWGYGDVERVLFNLPDILTAVERGEPILLVEGEKTAEALEGLGLVTTTIPGGAYAPWLPQYTATLQGAHVVILRDQDNAGHQYGKRAAHELYGRTASLKIVDLPGLEYRESHGPDPEDWIRRSGTLNELLEIIDRTPEWERESVAADAEGTAHNTASRVSEKRLRLVTLNELLEWPPIDYLVDGILPRGALAVLYGLPATGKTFTALHLALTLSRQSVCVYIAGEGLSGYRSRVEAWMAHHGRGADSFYLVDNRVSLMDDDQVSEFIDLVGPLQPTLVVVDTLARAMLDGDENSARDMGHLIDNVNLIQRSTGATVLLVHHSTKSNGSERGSSALRGAADVMIEVTNESGLITLKCTKSKDDKAFLPRLRRLHVIELPSGSTSCVLIPAETVTARLNGTLSAKACEVLEALLQTPSLVSGATAKELTQAVNIAEGSVHRVLNELKEHGYVEQPKPRGPYVITEKAQKLLDDKDKSEGLL